ncbi:methyl-accepting chemotaxis protein [Nitrosophilus kaiyonis]|uniref:methyl-accepting chemotaxis protein n=1 Tax=Nitrosophilus kaiyonis TaxID=2930200 RepID=UPI002492BF94|nr:methyl-accepting chemotaxis protein [Nitrosophilus kaiyonis]
MGFLKDMTIKAKLILLVAISVFSTAILSYILISNNYHDLNKNQDIKREIYLAIKISNLVHELQKERGRTAGFLGSGGKKFSMEIKEQRKLTDKRKKELENFIKSESFEKINIKIKNRFKKANNLLQIINKVRNKIDSFKINAKDAISYYTKMNGLFLDTIAMVSKKAHNEKLAKELIAYTNFLLSKERAGIERAVLSNTFARDKFLPGFFVKFITLISEQKSFLKSFEVAAPQNFINYYKQTLKGKAVDEVKRMENIAIEKANIGGFNIDPSYWFKEITMKINLLKKVEDYISKELIKSIDIEISKEEKNILINSIYTIVAIFITLLLGYLIAYRSINLPISKIRNILEDIAHNKDLTKKIELDTKDEIGEIATSINEVLSSSKNAIIQAKIAAQEDASIAAELSSTAMEIGKRAEEEATIVSETTNKANATKSPLEESIKSLDASSSDISKANEKLESTKETILNFIDIVKESAENESKVVKDLENLVKRADETKDVLDLIENIANQTNLLALNAAIEAARAGEHGKGFAVVAEEVRNLAEKSGEHVETINETINRLISSINEISNLISNNAKEFVKLTDSASKVEKDVDEITEVMETTVNKSKDSSTKIKEISKEIEEIIADIDKINEISSSNARSVEEIATATEHLYKQIEDLSNLLDQFKT